MREYYARFFQEIRREVFIFWKAQVGVSAGAAIVAAIANSVRQQSSINIALWSLGLAVVGYLAMVAIFCIFAIMSAPVVLDRQRAAVIATANQSIEALRDVLSRKHPYNEQLEEKVTTAITGLSEAGRAALRWLFDNGGASYGHIFAGGFQEGVKELTPIMNPVRLLIGSPEATGTFFQINPNIKDAVRNVLYPPPRPVAPSPS